MLITFTNFQLNNLPNLTIFPTTLSNYACMPLKWLAIEISVIGWFSMPLTLGYLAKKFEIFEKKNFWNLPWHIFAKNEFFGLESSLLSFMILAFFLFKIISVWFLFFWTRSLKWSDPTELDNPLHTQWCVWTCIKGEKICVRLLSSKLHLILRLADSVHNDLK